MHLPLGDCPDADEQYSIHDVLGLSEPVFREVVQLERREDAHVEAIRYQDVDEMLFEKRDRDPKAADEKRFDAGGYHGAVVLFHLI